jgi:hypothetical protein
MSQVSPPRVRIIEIDVTARTRVEHVACSNCSFGVQGLRLGWCPEWLPWPFRLFGLGGH